MKIIFNFYKFFIYIFFTKSPEFACSHQEGAELMQKIIIKKIKRSDLRLNTSVVPTLTACPQICLTVLQMLAELSVLKSFSSFNIAIFNRILIACYISHRKIVWGNLWRCKTTANLVYYPSLVLQYYNTYSSRRSPHNPDPMECYHCLPWRSSIGW